MLTRVQKWGNSLALRIPRTFAAEVEVADGSEVDLSVEEGTLMVRPARRRKYALRDLLRGVTPKNRHEEIATGRPRGREAW